MSGGEAVEVVMSCFSWWSYIASGVCRRQILGKLCALWMRFYDRETTTTLESFSARLVALWESEVVVVLGSSQIPTKTSLLFGQSDRRLFSPFRVPFHVCFMISLLVELLGVGVYV